MQGLYHKGGMRGNTINTVTITLRVISGKREELLQTIRALHVKMKEERGFLKFSVYQDVEDADTFNLIQEWETADDLEKQIRSEDFRVLIGALKVLSVEAEVRYRIGSPQKGIKIYEVTS